MDARHFKEFINKLPLTSSYKDEIYNFVQKLVNSKNTDIASFSKITDYLYETTYSAIDYEFAKDYYKNNIDILPIGGCSSINFDKYLIRNFDLTYDDRTTIVVRTQGSRTKYKTLGVCSYEAFTKTFIQSEENNIELYKLLPFIINDGFNQAGLSMSVNLVPSQYAVKDAIPTGEVKDTVYTSMLIRYILDRCATVDEAITLIKEHLIIKPSKWTQRKGYDVQFIIADNTKSKVITFIEDKVVDTSINYITNFNVHELIRNNDGSVYTPATLDSAHKPSVINKIQSNGQGLERFNLINTYYNTLEDKTDIINLLAKLKYTNAYLILEPEDEEDEEEDPIPNLVWYTEFSGLHDTTIDSIPSDYSDVVAIARTRYANRSKDPSNPNYGTWETVHSSIYDRNAQTLSVYLHENFVKEYIFAIDDNKSNGVSWEVVNN